MIVGVKLRQSIRRCKFFGQTTRFRNVSKHDRRYLLTTTTSPPSFTAIEEFSNRLRHFEKLVQFAVAKNHRRKIVWETITLIGLPM